MHTVLHFYNPELLALHLNIISINSQNNVSSRCFQWMIIADDLCDDYDQYIGE